MTAQVALGESVDFLYERTYQQLSKDVFRFILAWTNDWSSAEDLTQETYLRLWLHRGRVDWDRPMLPWLLVTARHLANNRFRALRRRLSPPQTDIGLDESLRARWLDVRAAFNTLTPLERTALIVTAVDGWSYAEAAQVLQTTDGALRAAVSRAREKLEAAS